MATVAPNGETAALLEKTKAAITALSVAGQTGEANAWLTDLEQFPQAWEIDELLIREPPGSQYRFFGAISLYRKAQRDLSQLDAAVIPGYAQNLVQHLILLAQEPTLEMNTCRYLCLSIAAIAVQLNQNGVVQQILTWLNPILTVCPRIVLELLLVLPEECFNRNVDVNPETREIFAQQLSQSISDVLGFLEYVRSTGPSLETIQQILKCLSRWIDYTDFPPSILASHSLYRGSLEYLTNDEVFESAVDVIIATWHRYRCESVEIVQLVFPAVLTLREKFYAVATSIANSSDPEAMDDEANYCRAVVRLATETAEACMALIVADDDMGQMRLLEFLIECSSITFEFSIARIPLKFFYDLSTIIKSSRRVRHRSSNPDGVANYQIGLSFDDDYDEYERVLMTVTVLSEERLLPVFDKLLRAVVDQMMLPVPVVLGQKRMHENDRDKRFELAETVIDCCEAIGESLCLQHLCGLLQGEVCAPDVSGAVTMKPAEAIQWNRVEAILYALQSVTPSLTSNDDAIMSQLMDFIRTVPEIPGMKATVITLIGKSARWLRDNPAQLPPLLTPLCAGLAAEATTSAASQAVMNVMKMCCDVPSLPVQELYTAVLTMRASSALTIDNDMRLLEGFSSVLSRKPKESQAPVFATLMDPIRDNLVSLLQAYPAGNVTTAQLNADIDRMMIIFKHAHVAGELVVASFTQLQPIFAKVLEVSPKENTCEKVCRLYKCVVKSAHRSFLPILQPYTHHIKETFERIPYSAFLYAASTCFSSFAREGKGAYVSILYDMLWGMSNTFFVRVGSIDVIDGFEKSPDLVEEYFYLLAKALQYIPKPFASNPGAGTILQAAMTGLQLQHKEAQKGILLFFENLAEYATRSSDPAARALTMQAGSALVQRTFAALGGVIPAYAFDENNGSICDLLWTLKLMSEKDLQEWIRAAVAGLPSMAQNVANKLNMSVALPSAANKEDFSKLLDHMLYRCTRTQ